MGSPECWWCGQREQSVEHLYTKCRRRRKERRKFVESLRVEGTSLEGRTERKRLAELLANEKAMGRLLDFLKSTEVGGREGKKDRELEWEQRIDHARKCLKIDQEKAKHRRGEHKSRELHAARRRKNEKIKGTR